ncbi:MAG: RidA family protein [Alphaproteobacteria bacterium]|nr:RidA family protein [Alphaproteobacteria bacterium]
MAGQIDARLKELGINVPSPAAPAANYVPFVRTGNLVFTAGQVTFNAAGKLDFVGKLGRDFGIEEGYQAARLCAINVLAALRSACGGDLDRVVRCVKVVGFVNATPDFADHPKVINGASDLIVSVFGDKGKHARSAVGMGSLPLGVATEVEGVFEIS